MYAILACISWSISVGGGICAHKMQLSYLPPSTTTWNVPEILSLKGGGNCESCTMWTGQLIGSLERRGSHHHKCEKQAGRRIAGGQVGWLACYQLSEGVRCDLMGPLACHFWIIWEFIHNYLFLNESKKFSPHHV